MEIKAFDFMPNSRFQKGADTSNPDAVGKHLELIRQKTGGKLQPEDVVDDAKNPNSPLHSFFEWDDTAAAHEHRLKQARSLIRTVVAVYKENPKSEPVRAYIHVRPSPTPSSSGSATVDDKPYYTEVTKALSIPSTRRAILMRAKADLEAWQKRYKDLKELADIVVKVEALALEIESKADEEPLALTA